jgi:hypothetical protein
MSTGNWSTGPHGGGHAAGNSMAAAVAVNTGVLQQLTKRLKPECTGLIRSF